MNKLFEKPCTFLNFGICVTYALCMYPDADMFFVGIFFVNFVNLPHRLFFLSHLTAFSGISLLMFYAKKTQKILSLREGRGTSRKLMSGKLISILLLETSVCSIVFFLSAARARSVLMPFIHRTCVLPLALTFYIILAYLRERRRTLTTLKCGLATLL